MNVICRLIGHEGDEYDDYPDPYVCGRCGACELDEGFRSPWQWEFRWRLIAAYHRLRGWLAKCSTCGRRFNRCPDDEAHIPF